MTTEIKPSSGRSDKFSGTRKAELLNKIEGKSRSSEILKNYFCTTSTKFCDELTNQTLLFLITGIPDDISAARFIENENIISVSDDKYGGLLLFSALLIT